MLESLIAGAYLGALLGIPVGPFGTVIIDTCSQKREDLAIKSAIGLILSDLLWLAFVIIISSILRESIDEYTTGIKVGSGISMIAFSLVSIYMENKAPAARSESVLSDTSPYLQGFLVGIINPAPLAIFLSALPSSHDFGVLYFGISYILLCSVWIFASIRFAGAILARLNPKKRSAVKLTVSLAVMAYGIATVGRALC